MRRVGVKSGLLAFALVSAGLAGGCGSQAILLGTEEEYFFSAQDVLAAPGQEVELKTRLQGGDLLTPKSGFAVRFYRDGAFFKAAETDDKGIAAVTFTPTGPGDTVFTARPSPNGFPDDVPAPARLLVACRKPDEPMVTLDMDHTLVASGFHKVLIGDAEPMDRSVEVAHRLAKNHSIVYLTHRPDYFGPKSKAWLKRHGYPDGPVILSDISGFLSGSEEFKAAALAELRKTFTNMKIGIGDKIADAKAYRRNGLRAFLILHPDQMTEPEELRELAAELAELDKEVQVVTTWAQIESVLFGKATFPPAEAQTMLLERAERLAEQATTAPAGNADSKEKKE